MEDLLQKHALLENDIALQAERVQSASAAALKFANGDSKCSGSSCLTLLGLLEMRTLKGSQAMNLGPGPDIELEYFFNFKSIWLC